MAPQIQSACVMRCVYHMCRASLPVVQASCRGAAARLVMWPVPAPLPGPAAALPAAPHACLTCSAARLITTGEHRCEGPCFALDPLAWPAGCSSLLPRNVAMVLLGNATTVEPCPRSWLGRGLCCKWPYCNEVKEGQQGRISEVCPVLAGDPPTAKACRTVLACWRVPCQHGQGTVRIL